MNFLFRFILLFFGAIMPFFSFSQSRQHHLISQDRIDKWGFYLMQEVGLPGGKKRVDTVQVCGEHRGNINVSNNTIKIDFWQISYDTCAKKKWPRDRVLNKNSSPENIFIGRKRTSLGKLERVLILPFRSNAFGIYTLPFRYRPKIKTQDGEVSGTATSQFGLGINYGVTKGFSYISTRAITTYSLTYGVFCGPASADLKKNTMKDPDKYVKDQINATVNYGLNLIFARNNIGLVFAIGFETMLGKNSTQWIYNYQPFFGFGVNTGLGFVK